MADVKMMRLLVVLAIMIASTAHALPKTTEDAIAGIIENLKDEVLELKQLQKEEDEKNGGSWNIFGEDVPVADTGSQEGESIYQANVEDKLQENFDSGNEDKNAGDSLVGDVIVTPVQQAIEEYDADPNVSSDALLNPAKLWRKQSDPAGSRVRVPYAIDSAIRGHSAKMAAIKEAIETYTEKTCIDFYEKKSSENVHHIRIINGNGCYSYIGRVGISSCNNCQPVSIGNGCQYVGTVEHELMHALGFYHEQSRPDRDDHVEIKWGNIMTGFDNNFKKERELNLGGQPYDLDSVMHYGGTFFSKNNQPTIVYKGTNTGVKANRAGFSKIDLAQINAIYKCKAPTTTAPATTTTKKPTPPPTTPAPLPQPEPEECEALAEVGMCSMSWICQSCQLQCENAQEKAVLELKDLKESCKSWKNKGYCKEDSKYHNYMVHKCHKTCFEDKFKKVLVLKKGDCIPVRR